MCACVKVPCAVGCVEAVALHRHRYVYGYTDHTRAFGSENAQGNLRYVKHTHTHIHTHVVGGNSSTRINGDAGS